MTGLPSEPAHETASEAPTSSPEGSMRGKIGRVAGASAVALLASESITLVQVIALARLLGPALVGIYTAGTVLTVLLSDFVEGGLRSALVQRQGRTDDAAQTVFVATIVSGFLLTLGALAAAPVIGTIFHNSTAGYVAAATSGTMLLYGLTNVPDAMLQRQFSVRRGLVVGPATSLAFGIVAVVLAARGWGVWSMVVGLYVSSTLSVVLLWFICDWRPGRGRFSVKLWRELARFGFPLMVMMFGFRGKNTVEAVIVGRTLGTAGLGQYRYAQRIAQIPEKGIINIGGIALLPAFSRISGDKERLRAAYLRALRWSMIAAAPLTGLMIALGVPAVVVVLGAQWREAGIAVVAMAGVGIGRAVESVSQEAIKGVGRTSLIHWGTVAEVAGGLILVLILVKPLGLLGVGLALSITVLIVGSVYLAMARSVVGVPIRAVVRALAPPLPAAAVACAVTIFLEHFVFHSDSHSAVVATGLLVVDLVAFATVYLAVLFLLEPATVREIAQLLVRFARRTAGRREQS